MRVKETPADAGLDVLVVQERVLHFLLECAESILKYMETALNELPSKELCEAQLVSQFYSTSTFTVASSIQCRLAPRNHNTIFFRLC